MDDFYLNTCIYLGFPIATFDCPRVIDGFFLRCQIPPNSSEPPGGNGIFAKSSRTSLERSFVICDFPWDTTILAVMDHMDRRQNRQCPNEQLLYI